MSAQPLRIHPYDAIEQGRPVLHVPADLLDDERLSPRARWLVGIIACLARQGACANSEAYLASACRCSVRHLRRLLAEARAAGWLQVLARPGLANTYTLTGHARGLWISGGKPVEKLSEAGASLSITPPEDQPTPDINVPGTPDTDPGHSPPNPPYRENTPSSRSEGEGFEPSAEAIVRLDRPVSSTDKRTPAGRLLDFFQGGSVRLMRWRRRWRRLAALRERRGGWLEARLLTETPGQTEIARFKAEWLCNLKFAR